jgi:hypothetical protein
MTGGSLASGSVAAVEGLAADYAQGSISFCCNSLSAQRDIPSVRRYGESCLVVDRQRSLTARGKLAAGEWLSVADSELGGEAVEVPLIVDGCRPVDVRLLLLWSSGT